MKIERRITFIIGSNGFAAWKLNRLKILTSYFRSVIMLQNITMGGSANTQHILKVISLGSHKNDLCQLWIEGADAELACMVLTDFIAEQFEIVNTSHKRSEEHCNLMIKNHPTFHLPFLINYYFESIKVNFSVNKHALLKKISTATNRKIAPLVFTELLKREEISSTGVANGVAIPHIMIPDITTPSLLVLDLDQAINWHSDLGDICLIIAILIPESPSRDIIKALTKITRALLDPNTCYLLTSSTDPESIKAILFHIMAKVFINEQET